MNKKILTADACMDADGTSPWTGEGRIMQEQIVEGEAGARAEDTKVTEKKE